MWRLSTGVENKYWNMIMLFFIIIFEISCPAYESFVVLYHWKVLLRYCMIVLSCYSRWLQMLVMYTLYPQAKLSMHFLKKENTHFFGKKRKKTNETVNADEHGPAEAHLLFPVSA